MDQCQPVTMSDGITVRVQGDTDKWTDEDRAAFEVIVAAGDGSEPELQPDEAVCAFYGYTYNKHLKRCPYADDHGGSCAKLTCIDISV